jgi:hypothetical protein
LLLQFELLIAILVREADSEEGNDFIIF